MLKTKVKATRQLKVITLWLFGISLMLSNIHSVSGWNELTQGGGEVFIQKIPPGGYTILGWGGFIAASPADKTVTPSAAPKSVELVFNNRSSHEIEIYGSPYITGEFVLPQLEFRTLQGGRIHVHQSAGVDCIYLTEMRDSLNCQVLAESIVLVLVDDE